MKLKNITTVFGLMLLMTICLSASNIRAEVLTGVVIEGDSMFNGTTSPQTKPYNQPYTDDELKKIKFSAERGSKLFIITKDGQLYYPTPKQGVMPAQTPNAPRITRVFGATVNTKGLFKWLTLVHVVGHEVEVTGETYPGYSGIKGFHIETIKCDDAEKYFQLK